MDAIKSAAETAAADNNQECLISARERNNLDLIAQCDMQFSKYSDDWIVNEYFIDHDCDFLVSVFQ